MPSPLNTLACLIGLLGAWIVVCNWGCVIGSTINQRRGIDRHYSMIPLLPQLLFLLAGYVSSFESPRLLSNRLLIIAALCDIGLLSLLALPFFLLSRRRKDPK